MWHGYRIVRVPADIEPRDPGEADLADRIASLIARRSCYRDGAYRVLDPSPGPRCGATRADVCRVA
jgi:hypothetical protein